MPTNSNPLASNPFQGSNPLAPIPASQQAYTYNQGVINGQVAGPFNANLNGPFQPPRAGGSVQGAFTGAPQAPQPASTGGGGGGGGYYGASQQQSLIEQQRANAIDQINRQYTDLMTDFDRSQGLLTNQANQSRDFLNQSMEQGMTRAEREALTGQNQARQNYQDLVAETRRRTRAVGGAPNSGYLNLTNRLDTGLQGNLNDIATKKSDFVNNLSLAGTQEIARIQSELDKQLASIESNRRTSAREKDAALKNAELKAAEELLAVSQRMAAQRAAAQQNNGLSDLMTTLFGGNQQQGGSVQGAATGGYVAPDGNVYASAGDYVRQNIAFTSPQQVGPTDYVTGGVGAMFGGDTASGYSNRSLDNLNDLNKFYGQLGVPQIREWE